MPMNDFINEYNRLCSDAARVEKFKKSGEDGVRIFNVLNSNIKTLKTVGEYIDTLYGLTIYNAAYKQKIRRVREFNFRSLGNHTDVRAITRSDIVILAGKAFGGYGHAFVTLLLYLLLLDVGSGSRSVAAVRTSAFLEELPVFIKRRLYAYAKEIAESGPLPDGNIYQQIVVYYGDQRVYREFLAYISDYYPDEALICALFQEEATRNNSPVSQRLNNFQRSALKKDALYAVIFYSLDQYVRECKMVGLRTGKSIREGTDFLLGYFDYFDNIFEGSLSWLGELRAGENMDTLKDFVRRALDDAQREEICRCIVNAFDLSVPTPSF